VSWSLAVGVNCDLVNFFTIFCSVNVMLVGGSMFCPCEVAIIPLWVSVFVAPYVTRADYRGFVGNCIFCVRRIAVFRVLRYVVWFFHLGQFVILPEFGVFQKNLINWVIYNTRLDASHHNSLCGLVGGSRWGEFRDNSSSVILVLTLHVNRLWSIYLVYRSSMCVVAITNSGSLPGAMYFNDVGLPQCPSLLCSRTGG